MANINIFDIVQDIERFNFNYIVSDQRVITDEGRGNAHLEDEEMSTIQYLYVDSKECGNRSPLEIRKLKMINELLEIVFNVYLYGNQLDPNYYPRLMGYDPREQYEEEAVLNDAPPDGHEVDGDSCVDSEMTVDIDFEDLADHMKDVEL